MCEMDTLMQASQESGSPDLYTYHGPNAPHRQTMPGSTMHAQYQTCRIVSMQPRMMDTPGFIVNGCRANAWVLQLGFHVSQLTNDWLHVLDLTVIPDMAASALLELSKEPSDLLATLAYEMGTGSSWTCASNMGSATWAQYTYQLGDRSLGKIGTLRQPSQGVLKASRL